MNLVEANARIDEVTAIQENTAPLPETFELDINVTRKHINDGICYKAGRCAVSLAVQDAFHAFAEKHLTEQFKKGKRDRKGTIATKVATLPSSTRIEVDDLDPTYGEDKVLRSRAFFAELPDDTSSWVNSFDDCLPYGFEDQDELKEEQVKHLQANKDELKPIQFAVTFTVQNDTLTDRLKRISL